LGETELLVQLQARPAFRLDVLLTDGRAATALSDLPQLVGMAPFTGISVEPTGADQSTGSCTGEPEATGSPACCTPSAMPPDRCRPRRRPNGPGSGPKE
jgi:hypothetical protein